MKELRDILEGIKPRDREFEKKARANWDNLLHPIGSLGELEELSIKIISMRRSLNANIKKRCIVVMCSDNGIVDAGVTSSPKELTVKLTKAMLNGLTGVCALAKDANADIKVVDMGMLEEIFDDRLIKKRIANTTKNFLKEAAMTKEEAIKAIKCGIDVGNELYKKYDILGTGELGMANTTTSAAVIAAILKIDPIYTVGRGSGVTKEQLKKKLDAVNFAIKKYDLLNKDAIEILSAVGGFDIAGLAGLFIAAGLNQKPIVIDGLISAAGALVSHQLQKHISDYMIGSHKSIEKGQLLALEKMGVMPLFDLKMRLGEGSGCPIAFKILDSAFYAMENMGTYEQNDVKKGILVNIRDN